MYTECLVSVMHKIQTDKDMKWPLGTSRNFMYMQLTCTPVLQITCSNFYGYIVKMWWCSLV